MNIKKLFLIFFAELIITGISHSLIGPLIPVIVKDLNVNLNLIGLALSVRSFGLLIISITIGNLIQLFGHKKVFLVGMILSFLGCLGLFLSYNYYIFLFSFLIGGIGTQIIFISTNSLICDLHYYKRSNALLTLNTGWLLGGFFTSLLASFIVSINYSWRFLFLFISIIQIIILFYIPGLKFPINNNYNKENLKSLYTTSKKILTNFYFIFCCIIVFFYAAITSTFSVWFTTYFSDLNVDVKISSIFLALYSVSLIIGMFLKKFLLKYFNEKQILLYSSIIALVSLLLSLMVNIIFLKIILILIFGVNIIGFITISISLGIESNPRYSGHITGLIEGANFLGIIIFHYIVGYLSENFSRSSVLYIDLILLFALCITTLIFNIYSKSVRTKAL